MKTLALAFEHLVKAQKNSDISLYLQMHENWEHIVGKNLASVSSFNGVTKTITGDVVANISVVSSAIVQIKEKENKIASAIVSFSNGKYKINSICWRHTIIDVA